MCSIRPVTADFVVLSVVADSSTNLVKVSTITRMYPLSGNGPIKSMFMHSIGAYYVDVVKRWVTGFVCQQTSFGNTGIV